MLRHLNRDYGTDFRLDAFEHRADYNRDEGRVELRLVSVARQEVSVGGEPVRIEEGEAILTEYSHKYTLDGFAAMAARAGFSTRRAWTDSEQLFSVQYCVRQ